MNKKFTKTICASFFVGTIMVLSTIGCNQENKEALPHTDPAKVQQARQETIDRVKNNPNMSPAQKEKALQYMGGGANAPKPLGATSDSSKP